MDKRNIVSRQPLRETTTNINPLLLHLPKLDPPAWHHSGVPMKPPLTPSSTTTAAASASMSTITRTPLVRPSKTFISPTTATRTPISSSKTPIRQQPDPSSHERKRREWKHFLSKQIIYFDNLDANSYHRVSDALSHLNTKIEPFYQHRVTLVVTKRPPDAKYPIHDVITKAHQKYNQLVWSFDKLVDILKFCGCKEVDSSKNKYHGNLKQYLSNEKQQQLKVDYRGDSTELSATNLIPFRDPYILIWDPKNYYQPIECKEFHSDADSDRDRVHDWPVINWNNPPHLSLFFSIEKEKERLREEEEEKARRNDAKRNDEDAGEAAVADANEAAGIIENPKYHTSEIIKNAHHDTQASGITIEGRSIPTTTTTKPTTEPSYGGGGASPGTALLPGVAPSREVINLQRKVLVKRAKEKTRNRHRRHHHIHFCENCKKKYTDYEEHRKTPTHQAFLHDDSNFHDIDDFLRQLTRKPRTNGPLALF